MREPEWMKAARANGLAITETTVNPAAVGGRAVGDEFVAAYLDGCSEDEFQGLFAAEAVTNGWAHAHCRRVKQSRKKNPHTTPMPAGWTDSVCIRRGVILFAELKVEGNTLTPAQEAYAELLLAAAAVNPNVEYRLWTPDDWPEIVTFLKTREAI